MTTVRRTGYSVYRDGSGVEETDDDFAERLQAAIDDAREEIEKETEQYRLDLEKAFRAKVILINAYHLIYNLIYIELCTCSMW